MTLWFSWLGQYAPSERERHCHNARIPELFRVAVEEMARFTKQFLPGNMQYHQRLE